MTPKLIKWQPIARLANMYFLDSIIDDYKGLKLLLFEDGNEDSNLQIIFQDSVSAYLVADESMRLRSLDKLLKEYRKTIPEIWTFFKIINSPYLQWLSEESYGVDAVSAYIHFSLVTVNTVVDIAAKYEPIVELITIT